MDTSNPSNTGPSRSGQVRSIAGLKRPASAMSPDLADDIAAGEWGHESDVDARLSNLLRGLRDEIKVLEKKKSSTQKKTEDDGTKDALDLQIAICIAIADILRDALSSDGDEDFGDTIDDWRDQYDSPADKTLDAKRLLRKRVPAKDGGPAPLVNQQSPSRPESYKALWNYETKLTEYIDGLVIDADIFGEVRKIREGLVRTRAAIEILRGMVHNDEMRLAYMKDHLVLWQDAEKNWNALASRLDEAMAMRNDVRSEMRKIYGREMGQ